jgi:adenylosuccinate lyase
MLSSLQGKTPLKMSDKQKMTFSPLDGRYRNDLPWELSEEASLFFQLEVEKAWFKILIEKGLAPKISDSDLNKVFSAVTQEKIDEIEKTTRHATRALVEAIANEFKAIGQVEAARWVHVGLTSFDTVDTAQRLRLRAYMEKAFHPALESLKKTLRELARKNKDTLQCG